ncbi:MAG: hypothetical protein IJ280_05995 [Bacteroidales bacterium]|nr:hypothetical protein [Bacteroidales bacterium]
MNMIQKTLLALCLLFASCTPSALDKALRLAGDNRGELEKVLTHYACETDDKQTDEAYRAAVFLIENMPGHGALMGGCMPQYIAAVDSLYPDMPDPVRSVVYTIPHRIEEYAKDMSLQEDIHHIKADWLIAHIDNKMQARAECPWVKKLPFEVFCQYVLPYRFAQEPLIARPDSSRFWWKSILETVDFYSTLSYSMDELRHIQRMHLGKSDEKYRYNIHLPVLEQKHIFDCLDDCYYNVAMLRAAGIPACIDFVGDWPTRNGRHYWRVLMDEHYLFGEHPDMSAPRAAKVFRWTFSQPMVLDVTDKYIDVANVSLKLDKKICRSTDEIYLAVFNTLQWKPIVKSHLVNGRARFDKMGKDIVYLPVYFRGEEMLQADYPFLLDAQGCVKKLIPVDSTHSLTLYRKYPITLAKLSWSEKIVGCHIEASNHADFSHADTIHNITAPNAHLTWTEIRPEKSYRYWRFVIKERLNLGEMIFLDEQGNYLNSELIFHPSNKAEKMTKPATDGDVLTYTNAQEWIGMDFGKPTLVSAIRFITRTDDNGINPGQTYELSYWTQHGEQVIEQKVATADSICFHGVPRGALLWLKNLETGLEERPFIVDENRILYY